MFVETRGVRPSARHGAGLRLRCSRAGGANWPALIVHARSGRDGRSML